MINLNLTTEMPRMDFKNFTAMKIKEQMSNAKGQSRKMNASSDSNRNEQSKFVAQASQKKEQNKRGPTPGWLKLLIAALIVAVALPTITWLLNRIAELIRAARNVEEALL